MNWNISEMCVLFLVIVIATGLRISQLAYLHVATKYFSTKVSLLGVRLSSLALLLQEPKYSKPHCHYVFRPLIIIVAVYRSWEKRGIYISVWGKQPCKALATEKGRHSQHVNDCCDISREALMGRKVKLRYCPTIEIVADILRRLLVAQTPFRLNKLMAMDVLSSDSGKERELSYWWGPVLDGALNGPSCQNWKRYIRASVNVCNPSELPFCKKTRYFCRLRSTGSFQWTERKHGPHSVILVPTLFVHVHYRSYCTDWS